MAFRIQDIKSALAFDGARPSLFNVTVTFPPNLGSVSALLAAEKLRFLCRAANLPASSQPSIEVPYFGRRIKVAGQARFEDWTITVVNDEDFLIRDAFEAWMQGINGHESNLRNNGITSAPTSYKADAHVQQFGKDSEVFPIRKYRMEGLFPTAISAIEVNHGNENEIETFTVTLAYDKWELDTNPAS